MDKYTKVDGHPNLVRNNVGVILNVNSNEATLARRRKKVWREQQAQIESLASDVDQIKKMLMKLVEDKDGSNSN
tara:strand:+ start:3001 stop:3222 length:222 start_codon:yes stop_codon:yes gene_type:complete